MGSELPPWKSKNRYESTNSKNSLCTFEKNSWLNLCCFYRILDSIFFPFCFDVDFFFFPRSRTQLWRLHAFVIFVICKFCNQCVCSDPNRYVCTWLLREALDVRIFFSAAAQWMMFTQIGLLNSKRKSVANMDRSSSIWDRVFSTFCLLLSWEMTFAWLFRLKE